MLQKKNNKVMKIMINIVVYLICMFKKIYLKILTFNNWFNWLK